MKVYIGTSGWIYKDWDERFYPSDVKDKDKLQYLASQFSTVEINSSFYRMPPRSTFGLWHKKAPAGFVFSAKFPRYITQRKKLIIDEMSKPYIRYFIDNSLGLKEKLAVVLIQLPPNFSYNIDRLEIFLKFLLSCSGKKKYKPRFALEFRNESWFNEDVYSLLRENNIALVISNSSIWPERRIITTDFTYIRMHGPAALFASSYSNYSLKKWAHYINNLKNVDNVYVYFNNDMSAKAVQNAQYLIKNVNNSIIP